MKKHKKINWLFALLLLLPLCASCGHEAGVKEDWEEQLSEEMPLLGHRNWIVITDMAYPLQNKPGIEMIYTGESFENVIETVSKKLKKAPHVYAHYYQDEELKALTDDLCPGIQDYRSTVQKFVPENEVSYVRHDKLLSRINSVSNSYNVLVIKTKLVLPYTSLFIELDCKYWNKDSQEKLEKTLREMK